MPKVCRIGDTGTHPGRIVTGSPDTFLNGQALARVGDIYDCQLGGSDDEPPHGPNPIVTGSPKYFVNGRAVARIGDKTQCGCVLTTGADWHTADGE